MGIFKLRNKSSGLNVISSAAFFVVLCFHADIFAEGDNQEIFNQLYNEIVNSSSAGNPLKTDSMGSGDKSGLNPGMEGASEKGEGPVTEHLRKEIEKIIKEVQLRHSDAVKFMQDAE